MKNLEIFIVLFVAFFFLGLYLFITRKKFTKKIEELPIVRVKKIIYDKEDNLFYCEFFWDEAHRFGYIEVVPPELHEKIKQNRDIELECEVHGLDSVRTGRWLLVLVNSADK